MYDIFLKGTIKTVSPVTFTTPDPNGHMIAGSLPLMGGRLYVPASSIRGALRRKALSVISGNTKFSLADYYLNAIGGVKGSKTDSDSNEAKTWIECVRRVQSRNPQVSLFGAMAPATVPGKLSVDHAIDVSDYPVRAAWMQHVRVDDLKRDPSVLGTMSGDIFDEYEQMKSGAAERSELKAQIKKLESTLSKSSDDQKIREEIAVKKEELKKLHEVQIQLHNLQYQVIPSGVIMASGFRIMNVTEAEASLFMKALDSLALNPVLGGRRNHGNGLVAGNWEVLYRENGSRSMRSGGNIAFEGDFYPAKFTGKADEWANTEIDWNDYNFSAELLKQP
ncbi:MAG: hypothetical protein KGI54_05850 [Pseudomonadota bacterium]|nr:hypothetical protein [Pseudomonadota bacterium]